MRKIVLLLLLFPFINGCKKKEKEYLIDKQVRLEFNSVLDFVTSDTAWQMPYYETWQLVKFNKHNYVYDRVKSIIFSPSLHTSDSNVTCYIDLYNVTDNVPIANSMVSSNDTSWHYVPSQDIKDQLPDKEVTLSIRIRSQRYGTVVSTGVRNFIFINRE